ncbi:MAG: cyclic nucleotide-binding domain-containing protein [Myxococcota bacterium]|nr:cyclic nucleotide-binding domain-containing protein [Myxococcota bacterium]
MRDHDDHDPVAIQRLLVLRQFPGFADAELSELATIAENVIDHTWPAGSVVVAPGGRVPSIQLVVAGQLATEEGDTSWGPRELFGAFEVMAGRAAASRVVAVSDTRTLQLAASDFAEIMEDSYSLLTSARRALARRLLALGGDRPCSAGALSHPVVRPTRLDMVDRLIVLRQQLPFSTSRIQPLAALAQATEELRLPVGALLARRGELPEGAMVLLEGAARATHPQREPRILVEGHAIGGLETLAELPYAATIEAVTPVRALRIPNAAMFDVMEDHPDFAIAMLGRLANALLESSPRSPAPLGAPPDDPSYS